MGVVDWICGYGSWIGLDRRKGEGVGGAGSGERGAGSGERGGRRQEGGGRRVRGVWGKGRMVGR